MLMRPRPLLSFAASRSNLRPPLQNTLRDPRIFYRRRAGSSWLGTTGLRCQGACRKRAIGCRGSCASGQAVCQCWIGRSRFRQTWRQSSQQTSLLMRPPHRYGRKRPKSSSQAFLPSGTHVIASQTERNTSVDRRTTFGLRVD